MAISILFGLLFITPCIVFEVHGIRRMIVIKNPESTSDNNTGDLFRNNGNSLFSSFSPMKNFNPFGFPSFDKPDFMDSSFAGSNLFKSTRSMFDNGPSLFPNPTKLATFSTFGQNNNLQNVQRSINDNVVSADADGLKPLFSERYPTDTHKIVSSVFDQIKMPNFGGFQSIMSQGNEDSKQRGGNMKQSFAKIKIEPFNYDGMQGMRTEVHSSTCCINGECFEQKEGEICGGLGEPTNNTKDQQQPISNQKSLKKLTPSNPTNLANFVSFDQNNDHQNDQRSINNNDVSVDTDGLKPLPRQRYPTDAHNIVSSVFDLVKRPNSSGLLPILSQGNEDGKQRGGNMKRSITQVKIEPLNNDKMKGMKMEIQTAQCCINRVCFNLKTGEICGGLGKPLQNNDKKNQQKPISNHESLKKITPGLQASDEDSISIESGDQHILNNYPSGHGKKNVKSNYGLDSYAPSSRPLNHQYVEPVGVTKNEADIIRNNVLDRTNYYRKNHNIPELQLNDNLNNNAQEWANDLVDGDIQRISDRLYGVNLFKGKVIENVGEAAVDEFYDEIAQYRPNDSESEISGNDSIHRLTQLLWIKSKDFGVGVSKNKDGQYTIVCNYNPKGNVSSLYTKNLPKITQEQVDAGKQRVQEKKKKSDTKYTVV